MANTFKSFGVVNISTGVSSVYTTPGATQTIVIGASVAALLATVQLVTFKVTKSVGSITTLLANGIAVGPKSSMPLLLPGQKLVLEAGDVLKVNADIANAFDFFMSFMEIT